MITKHVATTTIGDDVEVNVYFNYDNSPGTWHIPPYQEVEIQQVCIGDDDIMNDLSADCIQGFEDACWEEIKSQQYA